MADSLPADVIQAIAISNAKSIGEQPAILANLALAQQIFNQNMQQQIALSQQQAMNQVQMAAAAKCVTMIEKSDGKTGEPSIEKILKDIQDFMKVIQEKAAGNASDQ